MRAAIDIGSNSILLAIAEEKNSKLNLIVDECRVCGLVKKLDPQGRVSEKSLGLAKAALKEYRQILDQYSIESLHVLATESLRKIS
jgi:exopolyphosphatase / guanosine-5'-triphosphate,3'-diphosphate pyrophosphatase